MLELILWCTLCSHPKIDMPRPKVEVASHSFYDRTAKIELATWAAVGSFDLGQTCYHSKGDWHERWVPTQSCSGLAGFSFGAIAAEELVRYAFHRTHHRKLERLVPTIAIAGNLAGIITSYRHGPGCIRFGKDFWWNGQTCTNQVR